MMMRRPESVEPSISAQLAAACHAWLVLLCEDLSDKFSPAAHADLVKDGLEVILHGVGRDVKRLTKVGSGQPAQDESRDLAFPPCQPISIDDQRSDLRWVRLLQD